MESQCWNSVNRTKIQPYLKHFVFVSNDLNEKWVFLGKESLIYVYVSVYILLNHSKALYRRKTSLYSLISFPVYVNFKEAFLKKKLHLFLKVTQKFICDIFENS